MPAPHPGDGADGAGGTASEGVTLRTATASDLPVLAEIYNDAVLHSVATFDVERGLLGDTWPDTAR